jgi:hypothetical protein
MPRDEKTFMIEDANIIFRNFSGEESQFNRAGDRNFAVILDEKVAKQMDEDGWNVKMLSSREEGEPDTPYIQVAVGYKFNPPHIVMITDTARTNITEDMVGSLDWVDIRMVDLICRGYDWEVGGKTGTKAYLKTLFITVEEDALQRKYALMEQEG